MPKRTYKPAAKTGSKKKTVKQKPAKQKSSIDNRAFSIIMFAISALMFFVILLRAKTYGFISISSLLDCLEWEQSFCRFLFAIFQW